MTITKNEWAGFIVTTVLLVVNLSVMALLQHLGYGPSGDMPWTLWTVLVLMAGMTVAVHYECRDSEFTPALWFSASISWLIVPAGWLAEVTSAGQQEVAGKAFLFFSPFAGIAAAFGAAVFVLMCETGHR